MVEQDFVKGGKFKSMMNTSTDGVVLELKSSNIGNGEIKESVAVKGG